MKKIFVSFLFLAMFAPTLAFAQQGTFNPGSNPGSVNPGVSKQSGGGGSFTLQNPLKVESICGLLRAVLDAVLVIGLPVAVLFLVFAGMKYVLALGNPTKISEANKNLMWTVVGIGVFLGAVLISKVIMSTVQSISQQSGAGFEQIDSCR